MISNLKLKKNNNFSILRTTFLLLSVICNFTVFAKLSLTERLSIAVEKGDEELMQVLYSEITESDLNQLPDVSLLDYQYIAGIVNTLKNNPREAINHFLKAKEICDGRLGVHNIYYMEIMRNLGEQYCDMGDYTKALTFYDEGIIKSMHTNCLDTHFFANLIMGAAECYEYLGQFKEIEQLLSEAWSFWNTNNDEFPAYNYFPLWSLEQFYWRYELYDEAIKVSDEILKFISEKGNLSTPSVCDELFFRGRILDDMGKTLESVETYQNALNILDKNKLHTKELYGKILGNLLIAIVKTDKRKDYISILDKIKDYGEISKDVNIYKNALYSISKSLNEIGEYNDALLMNEKLFQQNLTAEERNIIEQQRKDVIFNKEITESKRELEHLFKSLPEGDAEWFEVSHKLSSAYRLNKEYSKNLEVLISMYQSIKNGSTQGNDYFLWVLNSLVGNYLDIEDYDNALKFAIEKKQFLESIQDVPETIFYAAINSLIVVKLRANNFCGIDSDLEECRLICTKLYGENSSNYGIFLHNKARAYQLQGKFNDAKKTYLNAIKIQRDLDGKPMARTVQFLMDVENQIVDEELND